MKQYRVVTYRRETLAPESVSEWIDWEPDPAWIAERNREWPMFLHEVEVQEIKYDENQHLSPSV